jgi:hypothetical protein
MLGFHPLATCAVEPLEGGMFFRRPGFAWERLSRVDDDEAAA